MVKKFIISYFLQNFPVKVEFVVLTLIKYIPA